MDSLYVPSQLKLDGIYGNMMVNNFAVDFLVDTGPEVTILPISYARHVRPQYTGKKMRATGIGGDIYEID